MVKIVSLGSLALGIHFRKSRSTNYIAGFDASCTYCLGSLSEEPITLLTGIAHLEYLVARNVKTARWVDLPSLA